MRGELYNKKRALPIEKVPSLAGAWPTGRNAIYEGKENTSSGKARRLLGRPATGINEDGLTFKAPHITGQLSACLSHLINEPAMGTGLTVGRHPCSR
jgi:hypothetical protein